MIIDLSLQFRRDSTLPPMPVCVNTGSALTIAVRPPRPLTGFVVTGCTIRVTNADGENMTVAATRCGNDYAATFPASHFAHFGKVKRGVAISIVGTDETGAERTWIEKVGSLYVHPTNAESEAGSGVCPTRAEVEAGWWSEWTFSGNTPPSGYHYEVVRGNNQWLLYIVQDGQTADPTTPPDSNNDTAPADATEVAFSWGSGDTAVSITATRYCVAAPVPTKTSDLTNDSGFLTQHQQLTPVYSDWTVVPPTFEGSTLVCAKVESAGSQYYGYWSLFKSGDAHSVDNALSLPSTYSDDVTHLDFILSGVGTTTATRSVIGYTLGSQSDKPLQPQGDYATTAQLAQKADASALRYDLVTITTGQLQDRAVQKVELNAASTTLVLPALTDLSGKVSDFGIDMVNAYAESGTAAAASFQLDGTLGTDYNLIVPKGETWSDMTTLEAGEMAVFYFTRSAFQNDGVPAWEVMKKVVEFVPVPAAP